MASDYIYANNLTAGQSQNFETFNFVESDKIEEMKKSFEVTKAKMEALLIAQLEMIQDDRKNEEQ